MPSWSLGPGAIGAGGNIVVHGDLIVGPASGSDDWLVEPVVSKTELAEQYDRFTGRAKLIRQIDDFIAENKRGYVLVRAEAGVGKSALAAHLVSTRHPAAYYFIGLDRARSPEEARKSIAAQLIVGLGLTETETRARDGAFPPGVTSSSWLGEVLRTAARKRNVHRQGQPLVLVVDGLDEARDVTDSETGVPLGLPAPDSLPVGVYIVATSRFGPELTALTHSNDCLTVQIQVDQDDGDGNVQDMRDYLTGALSGERPDLRLVDALRNRSVVPADLVETLVARCAGIWIYLKYVLDDIRMGRRDPRDVTSLPQDLRKYYWLQINGWAGDRGVTWRKLRRPTLTMLAAIRRPVTAAELARLTGADREDIDSWLSSAAQAFLNVTEPPRDQPDQVRRYAIRHESLRELLTIPDVWSTNRDGGPGKEFYDAAAKAHADITDFLLPPGTPESRDWSDIDAYTRAALAEHAAAADRLNDLMTDPGFLLACRPESILRHRHLLSKPASVAAANALEAALNEWQRYPDDRAWWLHVWARKTRATELAIAAARRTGRQWTVHTAMWTGTAHRSLVGHGGSAQAVAPVRLADGRTWLASGSADGTVRLWDPVAGTAVGNPLTGHGGGVRAVATLRLAGGAALLASGGDDGTVRLWDPAAGIGVGSPLTGHVGRVLTVAEVPLADGRTWLASGGDDGTVRLWDPTAGKAVGSLPGHDGPVRVATAVPLAGERTLLATGGDDRTVRLWDPVAGVAVGGPLTGHQDWVRSMAVLRAADGVTLLASGGDDGTVRLWDPAAGAVGGSPLTGHGGSVKAMVAVRMPDGRELLAAGGDDGQIRLWDVEARAAVGSPLTGHSRVVQAATSVALSDGRVLLATGGADETVRLWDPSTGTGASGEAPPTGHDGAVETAVAVPLADGHGILATAGTDGTVRLWDPMTGTAVGEFLVGHLDWVLAVAPVPLPDGRALLATGGTDGTVRLWDPLAGRLEGDLLVGHSGWVLAVAAVRPCGGGPALLATGGDDAVIRLWDPVTGRPVGEPLVGHTGAVRAMTEVRLPDGRSLLATGGNDLTIRLWDPATGTLVGEPLRGHHDWIRAMAAVSLPDGRPLLATGGDDRSIRLWDPVMGRAVGDPLLGHLSAVTAIAAVPPGSAGAAGLASGGRDGTVRIWDPVRGCAAGDPLTGHAGWVRAMAAVPLPDGSCALATAGDDGAVLVWGRGSGGRT